EVVLSVTLIGSPIIYLLQIKVAYRKTKNIIARIVKMTLDL
ncbi:13175_t:CDS:1, partial [Funneliformis mosseae]